VKKALTAAVVVAILATASTAPTHAGMLNQKGCPHYSLTPDYWGTFFLDVLAAFGITPGAHIQASCLE
jgi:hypothetical protein